MFFCSIDNITPDTLDECDREYDRLDDMYHARKSTLDAFEQWKLLSQQHAEFQVESDEHFDFIFFFCFSLLEKIHISCTFS